MFNFNISCVSFQGNSPPKKCDQTRQKRNYIWF